MTRPSSICSGLHGLQRRLHIPRSHLICPQPDRPWGPKHRFLVYGENLRWSNKFGSWPKFTGQVNVGAGTAASGVPLASWPQIKLPPPPRACLKVSKPARPGAACHLFRHSACSEFPNVHTVDKPTRTLRGRNRSPQVGNGSEEWLGLRCSLLDAGPVSSDSRVIPAGGRRPLVTHRHPEPLPSLLPGTLASPCLQAGPQLPVPQIPNSPK